MKRRGILISLVWIALLILWGLSTSAPAGATKRALVPETPRQSARALARLIVQPIPYRNLDTLADQLKLRPPRPIPHRVNSVPPNYPVGHQDRFFVLSEDTNTYFTVRATIRAETPHLYLYIQNGIAFNQRAVQQAAETFERSIYPTDRAFFGSPWVPGIADDQHITCLYANLKSAGAGGFFSAEDEYPRLVNPWSNQRNMVYINAENLSPSGSLFLQVMAHEFQHMIHWHMHPHDNAWLNEGMSMLAEDLNGYPPVAERDTYLGEPDTQLDTFTLDARNAAHYGGGYLFLRYLYDRFGRTFIHDTVADSRYTDFELIGDVLRKHHIAESADQIFADWVVANYVNNRSFDHGIYGYKGMNATIQSEQDVKAPFSQSGTLPPYAAQYVSIKGWPKGTPFRLTFSASPTVPLVGDSDRGPFWWSNRGDLSDTRLVRTVDLRHVHRATLHFQTWYDLETQYDYAYVEASTDGGRTWTTLPSRDTRSSNPTGANYGNGYTGHSDGWRWETVDLSRYAGRRIEIRFECITDDAINWQGFVVKNISIPEIGFHDDFSGWSEQGFVPVSNNSLPNQWEVELISYAKSGTTVTQLPVNASGQGSLMINPASEGLKRVVVVIFSMAPKTTVTSSFRLAAAPAG